MKILVPWFPDGMNSIRQDPEDSLDSVQMLVFICFSIVELQKRELQ